MTPPPRDPGGVFVSFEGIEGSGKSTQIERLALRLSRAGTRTLVTREPGGTELGRALRQLLLGTGSRAPDPVAELLLYLADRAEHLATVIDPALAAGTVVLCDRFRDATLAYQGHGRGIATDWIEQLHHLPALARSPDRTLLFDLPAPIGLARARRRNQQPAAGHQGRFEDEPLAFHDRVRNGYLALAAADPRRIRIIDADAPPATVEERVVAALADLLPALGADPC